MVSTLTTVGFDMSWRFTSLNWIIVRKSYLSFSWYLFVVHMSFSTCPLCKRTRPRGNRFRQVAANMSQRSQDTASQVHRFTGIQGLLHLGVSALRVSPLFSPSGPLGLGKKTWSKVGNRPTFKVTSTTLPFTDWEQDEKPFGELEHHSLIGIPRF